MTKEPWGVEHENDDKRFKLKPTPPFPVLEPDCPIERVRENIAAAIIAEAKAEREAKRARETPQERADREAREHQAQNDRSQGRDDGGRKHSRW